MDLCRLESSTNTPEKTRQRKMIHYKDQQVHNVLAPRPNRPSSSRNVRGRGRAHHTNRTLAGGRHVDLDAVLDEVEGEGDLRSAHRCS